MGSGRARFDRASIYVDCKKLRRLLQKAQFCMEKADRIVYGTPVLEASGKIIGYFVLAYDIPEERNHYIRKFLANFHILRTDIETINELNAIRETKDTHRLVKDRNSVGDVILKENYSGDKPSSIRQQTTELIARIEVGMEKWQAFLASEEKREREESKTCNDRSNTGVSTPDSDSCKQFDQD